ncbi:transglycosylase SLT domain-containing protein [Candidatus Bipolaricaulota bacterium]|nr:transglycosylase SLT domain-containing protein [Candidatus Bipolaricaulota bacterium]
MKSAVGPIILMGLLLALAVLVPWMASSPPEVGDYNRLMDARGRLPGSLPELESLAARDDGVGWEARVVLGQWYLAQGAPSQAIPFLRSALALYATADLQAELALAYEGAGHWADAVREWEALLPRQDAVRAIVRLEREPVRAASLLTRGGAPGEALSFLAGIGGAQAALERARALLALGKAGEAAAEFERYLLSFPGDLVAQFEYGRALERAGETEKAIRAYRAAGAAGAYAAGLLLESLGREEEAIAAYLQSSELEAKWRAARLLEGSGQTADAISLYWELARGAHRVQDDAALRLYLLHTRRGEAPRATEAARLLSRAFAWLVGEPPPPLPLVADPSPASPPVLALAAALAEAFPNGEGRRWADIELAIAASRGSAVDRLAIGERYVAQGDWRAAFRAGASVLSSVPCRRAYHLAYPLAWWDTVLRWAGAYGVDPYLVLAVIREESGFLPTAVSSSDARGLMQLLPSTARWIAEEKLKIPYREESLFDPDDNIRLGTWYLAHLLDQSSGNVAWAVAAYNGGPGNLRRWTADGVASPADLPAALRSTETREYLVKVLNAWLTYRWLYGS